MQKNLNAKRFVSFFIALFTLMLVVLPAMSIKAEEIGNGDSAGDEDVYVPSLETQIDELLADSKSMTEEEVNVLNAKKKVVNGFMGRAVVYSAKVLAVPYYKQEKSYWCGPATTKQALQYLTGSSPSQATIADSLGTDTNGTDGTKIVAYLNKKQSKNPFVIGINPTLAQLKTYVNWGVQYNYSGIARVKLAAGNGWDYSSAGHYFSIAGQKADVAEVYIVDPYHGWVKPNTNGKYYKTISQLRTAIINHFAQHYYW